jgi:phage I-like protein
MPDFTGATIQIKLENGVLPSRVPINPFGEFVGNGARYVFNDESLALVNHQLATRGNPFPLDYHHATKKVEEGTADKAPAAGFITGFEVDNGFVYGLVSWTELGAPDVASGAFAFISPVFGYAAQPSNFLEPQQVLSFHSFALTNKPGISFQRQIGQELHAVPDNKKVVKEASRMDKELLIKLLGLASDATDAQVQTALESTVSRARLGNLVMDSLELKPDSLETPETRGRVMRLGAFEGLGQQVADLRAELETERGNRNSERVTTTLTAALEAGRVLEPQKAYWQKQLETDFDSARVALEGMPSIVPTKPVQTDTTRKTAVLESTQLQINAVLGVSEESFTKAGA